MDRTHYRTRALAIACSLALAGMGGAAFAEGERDHDKQARTTSAQTDTRMHDDTRVQSDARMRTGTRAQTGVQTARAEDREDMREDAREARELLQDARETLANLRSEEPELAAELDRAPGVFVAPHYGRGALIVGARGGEGVLLRNRNGNLSQPVFYDFGGISAGLQAGAEGGALVMVLRTQEAVDEFRQENNWSLNADAGLTVVNWSARGQASAGKGDVLVWSDAKGLLGDLAISVTDINFDEDETAAYYGRADISLADVFDGRVQAPREVAGADAELEVEIEQD